LVIGVVVQRLSDLGMLEATGMVAQSVNPDISQEFGFGRPFCPAAAFSVKNVLSVFSNTLPVLFGLRPCIGPKFLAQNGRFLRGLSWSHLEPMKRKRKIFLTLE